MNETEIHAAWRTHGFVILPGYLSAAELAPAASELDMVFPSADGFHDVTDPRHERYRNDEFDGIDVFPFASTELSLLAVDPRLVELAERLLGERDLRIYSAEAWAKYTGATNYDQDLHRDYLNHTVLVPTTAQHHQQLEMFVFLSDVPEELGPPHLVSQRHTAHLPANPNFYPRRGGQGPFVAADDHADLYDVEQSGAGPAGTVIAFNLGTFHRGTALTMPRGARYTMHLGYRPAQVEWGQRQAWADCSHTAAWYQFVQRATPRQLELFGFPPPKHPFWNPRTLLGMKQRYPELDLTPWVAAVEAEGSEATVVSLRELTDGNRAAVLALRVAPEQEKFVGASVQNALADAAGYPLAKPWYRAVYAGEEPVGFVMISWNCEPRPPEIIGPWFLWKLLIDKRHQGHGYGSEVVRQVAELIRAEGATELLTSIVPGDGGPAGFYQRLGFVPTGDADVNDEAIVRLALV